MSAPIQFGNQLNTTTSASNVYSKKSISNYRKKLLMKSGHGGNQDSSHNISSNGATSVPRQNRFIDESIIQGGDKQSTSFGVSTSRINPHTSSKLNRTTI
jgi:hypothetical protein